MPGEARRDRARVRREVRDHHGLASVGLRQLLGEPLSLRAAPGDGVLDAEVAFTDADHAVVGVELPAALDHCGTLGLGCQAEVGPQAAAQETRALQVDAGAVHQPHIRVARGFGHHGLGGSELAFPRFVIAGHIQHRLGEMPARPMHTFGAIGDVTRQHHHIGLDRRWQVGSHLQMQVGQDVDAHRWWC